MLLKDRIKHLRKELNLTQKDLANTINKSIDRIKNIENGRVQKLHPDEIIALSNKYNINPDWLLTGEGEMYKENDNKEIKDEYCTEICENLKKLPKEKQKYLYHKFMTEIYEMLENI